MKWLGSAVGLLSLGFVLLVAGVPVASAQTGAPEPDHEFTIAVGETLTFDARNIRRVTTGDDSIADPETTRDGRHLFVTGRSPGVAMINIFSGAGDEPRTLMIRVVGVNPVSLAEEVRDVLGGDSGVDIRVVKGRVLIEGEVASEIHQNKIDRLQELYPDQILNFARYREAFVEGARMVALDVHFVQLATTQGDELGVRWDQFIGGEMTFGQGDVPLYYDQEEDLGPGVLPTPDSTPPRPLALTGGSDMTSYSQLVGNLNFALDLMVEHGMLTRIEDATVVTEAGTPMDYHSGGIFVLVVTSGLGVEVHQYDVGFELSVKPVVDFENNVKLDIDLRVREIDHGYGTEGYPGIRQTESQATVNMKEGQSVLISAHERTDSTVGERGFWMLQRIPILGWAFKSRSLESEEVSNAFFVTPRIYEPGTEQHRTMVQGVFQSLLDAGFGPEDLPQLQDADD